MIASLVALLSAAHAHTVTLCVDIEVEYFNDAAGGDNWLNNNVDKPARGLDFELVRYVAGHNVVASGSLGRDGSAAGPGCAIVSVPTDTYVLWVYPHGTIGTNTFEHEGSSEYIGGNPRYISANYAWDETISWIDESYSQLAILGLALDKHPGGSSSSHFPIEWDTAPHATKDTIFLRDIDSEKYLVAHEIGHILTLKRSGGVDKWVCWARVPPGATAATTFP